MATQPATAVGLFAAVDLGASSGRVLTGRIDAGRLVVEEQGRFPNEGVAVRGRLYWDVLALWKGILEGLRAAARSGPVRSVGVDGWAVDYGLMDDEGQLLGAPTHHRDERNRAGLARLASLVDPAEHYRRTGTAQLPILTAAQLLAEPAERLGRARRMLLLPDLFVYWLTGHEGAELTNASTTGLLAAGGDAWDGQLIRRLGLPPGLLAPLRRPGDDAGVIEPRVAEALDLAVPVPVTVVASHDTASAVAAVPAQGPAFGYVSAGTWSLVGIETDRPVLGEGARLARFTNERGADGTVRFLRNTMGLWLLEECRRAWRHRGADVELQGLLLAAAALPPLRWVIDTEDPDLLPPGDMPARICEACRLAGDKPPQAAPEVVRCIIDSLALAHRRALRDALRLTGTDVDLLHIVGGGARNRLLCQATADACGIPVVAGPAEASAMGNLLLQARARGYLGADPEALRVCVRRSVALVRYEPGPPTPWDCADARSSTS